MTAPKLSLEELQACLLSKDPVERRRADREIERILAETPEINPGFELPALKGVVRYDSSLHSAEDVAAMTPYLQERVARALERNPQGRVTITQTAPFPGDSAEDRRALIAARHGLRLV